MNSTEQFPNSDKRLGLKILGSDPTMSKNFSILWLLLALHTPQFD